MKKYISPKMEIKDISFNTSIATGLGEWIDEQEYTEAGITTFTYVS